MHQTAWTRPLAILAAASLALALVGCSGSSDADATTASSTDRSTTTEQTETTEVTPPEVQVTLLDPGAAPRRVVRQVLAAGDEARIAETAEISSVQRADGTSQRMDVPATRIETEVRVTEVKDGIATIEAEIVDAGLVDPGGAAGANELDDVYDDLVGATITYQTDDRNRTDGATFEPMAGTDPALAESLENSLRSIAGVGPALPDEEIGVGARWEVRTTRSFNGVEATVTATYTASEITEDALAFEATIEVVADEQPLALGTASDAMAVTLEEMTLTGEGAGRLSLTGPATTATSATAGTQVLSVGEGAAAVRVEVDLTQRSSVELVEG